jgi:hypothetical protein
MAVSLGPSSQTRRAGRALSPATDASGAVEPSPTDDTHHLAVLFSVLDWATDRVATLHDE